MADLASYIRHAERFGCDDVFETATADLEPVDLGRLSLRMQNIDARWKPPNPGGFALRLLAEGVPSADVCRMARIGRSTLWRLRREQDTPKSGRQAAFRSGESVSNRGTPTDGTSEGFPAVEGVSVDGRKAA